MHRKKQEWIYSIIFKLVTPSSQILCMRYFLSFGSEMVEYCTVTQKNRRWVEQWRHSGTLLHAQQHCLVEKHWIGHEEVPVPACHQPALCPWTSHMVFLSLLPMKGLDWTPSVSFTNTKIMSLWGEGGWWQSPQTVQGKYSWHMFCLWF